MDDDVEYIEINKCNLSFKKKSTSKKHQISCGFKWRIYKETRYEIGYHLIFLDIDKKEEYYFKFVINEIIIEPQDYNRVCEKNTSTETYDRWYINENRLVDLSMLDAKKYSDDYGTCVLSKKTVSLLFISE
ncbi:hypothetical protein RF11_10906 [Thelohanellus kitauei]|uniref:Uncharacterized protein n=1 Tax=Thelohanellus kitauei TaxID=669202 RepID=A0A0C2JXC6_THEKT|nr:hypothetical protein RF11_10906 [Thelohanellus kitauei]